MAQLISRFDDKLGKTNATIGGLMADFSGLNNMEKVVDSVLRKLYASGRVQSKAQLVKGGKVSLAEFDGWFSDLIRVELGRALGVVRHKAVEYATKAGAGSAASAVLRRMYKDEFKGAIHSLGNRSRISSRERVVEGPNGGKSGIRRIRTVSGRTKQLRKYYGPDRSFILRFLEGGTDARTASPAGPTGRGSRASYGSRGSISPRSFFKTLSSDMEQAAQEFGMTLVGHVENFVEQKFEEIQ